MAIDIKTVGRTDTKDLFRLYIGREVKLVHSPMLVLRSLEDTLHVEQAFKGVDLLAYPDETQVMVIWPGKWRSDYFHFTVGAYRDFYHNGESGKAQEGKE